MLSKDSNRRILKRGVFGDIDSVVYNLVEKAKDFDLEDWFVMGNYYSMKRLFIAEIQGLITNPKNKDKILSISELELKYGLKYGFGRSSIEKNIKVYERLGMIEMKNEEEFKIL